MQKNYKKHRKITIRSYKNGLGLTKVCKKRRGKHVEGVRPCNFVWQMLKWGRYGRKSIF